ncbi:MAG: hypothetical protein AB1716_18890 [Planctomycetota bacterium]
MRKLIRRYGGRVSGWVKKSSAIISVGCQRYEYHWYEHPGIGRVEIRRKRVAEP